VLVQIENQVVPHDGIAGGKKGHETIDQVLLRGRHALVQVSQVG
jgi:hypothetical protein